RRGRGRFRAGRPGAGHPAARPLLRRRFLLVEVALPARAAAHPRPHPGHPARRGRGRAARHLCPSRSAHAFLEKPRHAPPEGVPGGGRARPQRRSAPGLRGAGHGSRGGQPAAGGDPPARRRSRRRGVELHAGADPGKPARPPAPGDRRRGSPLPPRIDRRSGAEGAVQSGSLAGPEPLLRDAPDRLSGSAGEGGGERCRRGGVGDVLPPPGRQAGGKGGVGAPLAASPSVSTTPKPPKTPLSTYRIQLRPEFGFAAVAAIAGYLAELGISHLYASPYLQAAQGSAHGYDVIDHSRINEELGGAAGHAELCRALEENGLGQVLDVVPNHMAISSQGGEPRNSWWWDVLENGPSSRWAGYFDVDWDPPQSRLRNTVLMPILGDHYGRILEAGEMRLVRCGGKFEIHYHEHRMPVAPPSLDRLLAEGAARCSSPDLAFIADSYGQLPLATATDRVSTTRRHRDKEVLAGQLDRLCAERPDIAAAVDAVVAEANADPDKLDALLERQNYRPAFWRTAGRELDYRRFFDVNTLVGLRIEDERVFADVHALPLRWVRRGQLDGLRIDHPDGLRDPKQYFNRLREAAPEAWIVVEKILETGETLPDDWPVDGTTGYDFLNRVGGLFVDPAGEAPLSALAADFTGQATDWPALVRDKKLLVLTELLASDVNRLAEVFLRVCESHRRFRDFTRFELREALAETAACFPVYRTYVRPGETVSENDERAIRGATAAACGNRPDLPAELFDFLRDLLLLHVRGEEKGPEAELVMRFQQLTGPAMAKGVEDTAFYHAHRLVSLNEVGGDPGRFGVLLADFHRECAVAQESWPGTMTAVSTHDTKRSDDLRLRLHLLSEIPERWSEAVRRWSGHNERPRVEGPEGIPDRNTEYLLYQTLVGAWPLSPERATEYMEKAAREAKDFTSWTRVDAAWEEALRGFITSV